MSKRFAIAGLFLAVSSLALADAAAPSSPPSPRTLVFVEDGPVEQAVIYATGEHVSVPTQQVWRYMCGSDVSARTVDDLRRDVTAVHDFEAAATEKQIIRANNLRTGFALQFNVSGSLPAGAQDALDEVSAYFSTVFDDNYTVIINFSMTAMGGGVLGATSSSYASSASTPWSTVRNALINGEDLDDEIQDWLPSGTIPVRYDGTSATVTSENRCFFTVANFNAAIGSLGGAAASMQLNTQFSWDYNPTNGVSGANYCFRSVVVHEVCHALGFTSAADFRTNDIEALDIYRFQRTDGASNYNPDTLAQFQTTPRTVSPNSPDDDANSDVILTDPISPCCPTAGEFRMSDGSPNQASHFRSQGSVIGIMQPSLSNGVTFYPSYLRLPDLIMLDAIGWDYFTGDCNDNGVLDSTEIASNPTLDCDTNGTLDECEVGSSDCNNNSILDACELAGNDCNGDDIPDECELTGNDCNFNAEPDECDVEALGAQISAPANQIPCEGGQASFSVTAPGGSTYQWYQNNAPLSSGGDIAGANGPTLTISNVDAADVGNFFVEVSQGCITSSSSVASLSMVPASITVSQEPVAQVTICASSGQSAVFDFHVNNELQVSFQWYKDGQLLSNGGRINGATSSHLLIASAQPSDAGTYTAHASNPCGGSADSNPTRGKLVVVGATIVSQPQPTCTSVGGTARFEVRVEASAGTAFFWYRDGNLLSNGNDGTGMIVSGAGTDTLTLTNVPAAYNNHDFQFVSFNSSPSCLGQSNLAKLTVGTCGACSFKGDLDGDLDVDLKDLAIFTNCFGAVVSPGHPCECANLDNSDSVIDMDDWSPLEPLFNGPS